MRKKLILLGLALAAAAALQTTTAQAASGCYQVECNTCCKTTHGTVCTQRACL